MKTHFEDFNLMALIIGHSKNCILSEKNGWNLIFIDLRKRKGASQNYKTILICVQYLCNFEDKGLYTNGQAVRRTDKHTNKKTDSLTDRQIYRQTDKHTAWRINEQTDRRSYIDSALDANWRYSYSTYNPQCIYIIYSAMSATPPSAWCIQFRLPKS